MKTIAQFTLTFLAIAALGTSSTRAQAPVRASGGVVNMFVRGPGNSMVTPTTPASTPLWGVHSGLVPIPAPDGHQITLGEWSAVQMTASAKCVTQGTHVSIHATGLIPKGVYTIWVLVFNGPFDPTFSTLVGIGALGASDGSQNAFQASASGKGQLNVIMPAGILSARPYPVTGCLLDEVEVHLVGAYHFDGNTYGPTPGYPHGSEIQFGTPIKLAP